MIDLHSHTTESDGTCSPSQLVELAKQIGLEALGITDHDTLSGYDLARPLAAELGLELVCGIELSTKLAIAGRKKPKSVHLLAYFVENEPAEKFRVWLLDMQESRRDRNVRLVARLRELGLEIDLDEVRALGRNMTGRPHFARVLLAKGYVGTLQEAFDRYLDEAAPGYVDRLEPTVADAVARIREAGGISSLAHPIRLADRDLELEDRLIQEMVDMGLQGIEAHHSDHFPDDTRRYLADAARYRLAVTGGSDFHGDAKPGVLLGTGRGDNLSIPLSVLDALRVPGGCAAHG